MQRGKKPKKTKQAELPLETEKQQEKPKKQKTQFDFESSLVLFRYMLSLFGEKSLDKLCRDMKGEEWEGWDEQNISRFYKSLTGRLFEHTDITNQRLLQYDNNIASHTMAITAKRPGFRWKYFQYMSLLFSEIYLDKYFTNKETLLKDLNVFLTAINRNRTEAEHISEYTEDDLNKIAFWQATGSGKTLIMHVNILQYKHYLNRANRGKDLNRTILLTPNEGLSRQHREEFILSGQDADLFSKDNSSLFNAKSIEIIDIHKLKEQGREKTVSVDSFDSNNLVLVDEGHRGAGGEECMDKRNRLCEKGFSFEYSATFGQAMKASGKKNMLEQYAKCIIFDYSYKYFYGDGYGKEYSIINLAHEQHEEQRQLYLTACLLTFYQQLRVYDENKKSFTPFNVEEPLLVFVGSKVNAVRTVFGRKESDVISILDFIRKFITKEKEAKQFINRLLKGKSEINDTRGNDLFANRFTYLIAAGDSAEIIYNDIKERVFNNDAPGAAIHIDFLKGVEGEIGLRLGDAEYFGVINVGDDRELVNLCAENGFSTKDSEFSESLFAKLSSTVSPVKLLIGSKKFTEGWNSWRVSNLGLMNVGKSEGSEIIQLFGRGVRLKGYKESLKRSAYCSVRQPENIGIVETLSVFGVRADYMRQFREYLEDEGVKGMDEYEEIKLPCIRNFDSVKLKYPVLKQGANFKREGDKPILSEPDAYLLKHPVSVNWYPKIEALQSKGVKATAVAAIETGKLTETHTAFFDYSKIYFELQKYKYERNYFNLNIEVEGIKQLLTRNDWYELLIPGKELVFDSFEKTRMWQNIAIALLKKYTDNFYFAKKMDYEKDKIEYRYLDEVEKELRAAGEKNNLFDEYTFLVEKSKQDIIIKLNELKKNIQSGNFDDFAFRSLFSFNFDRHLYKPLIHIKDAELKVSPVDLNEGEKKFVEDLKAYYEANKAEFKDKELYLLRNLGRGRGIGFFQAHNFYPDFIMWLVEGKKQHITFVDPHGIRMNEEGFNNPKIQFFKEVKALETQIGDKDVVLNSYIISVTEYSQLNFWGEKVVKSEFERKNVIFQEDSKYISKILGIK